MMPSKPRVNRQIHTMNPNSHGSPSKQQKEKQLQFHHQTHSTEIPPTSEEKRMNIEQSMMKEAQEKRRRKAREDAERNNLEFASISAKL